MTSAACRAVMMAVRERAAKAMAAVDRRVPSLDDFVGQSWTAWADWAGVSGADGPDVGDCSKNGKKAAEAMSLSKEDMSIFGLYPGHDDFFLVVCSHCGQVVKPQAFEKHCERRHGALTKMHSRLRSPAPAPPTQRPLQSYSPSQGTNATAAAAASTWEGRSQGGGQIRMAPASPSTPPQFKHSKTSKDGLRPYNKVASKRECDLDKHCGVLDPERKKVCTRLLTCNIHSIHQRRKVTGRSKNFDQLVAELKTKVREKGAQMLEGGSVSGHSPSPEAPREQAGVPHCRRPLASLPAFSRSTSSAECTIEEEKQRQEEAVLRAPSPLLHKHVSSDESEGEDAEELSDFSSSSSHPRPAALCTFGSHCLGHGIYTFDRRLHHLRAAFSSMLEQHISAHLWRRIPQATDFQSSPSTKASTSSFSTPPTGPCSSSLHFKVRTGSHISSSLKNSLSPSSRGPGRPTTGVAVENSGGGSFPRAHPEPGGKQSMVRPIGLGRHKNPVGRPSRQMVKLREDATTAATVRKRKAPSQEGEHSGPDRNCIVLQDRGRPHSAPSSSKPPLIRSFHTDKLMALYLLTDTPLNAPFLPPRIHPNKLSLQGGTRGRGLHGGGRGFEQQGLLKKRKLGGLEEPSSKPPAQRPPSSSSSSQRSNFYSWKDSKGGGLAGGVEKKLSAQKPKLHH
ncbi:hypothetical protein OJAV_G00043420 [Oryzias javanicus]|uniref:SCA7 domain-containing protein n=1 Tax=Oryzias javanicus TaxID=123683 RepID=A0A437DDC6_ORYJA|nr:hypothetical protein OJAV_G00043420 [Oryzias javanicus]